MGVTGFSSDAPCAKGGNSGRDVVWAPELLARRPDLTMAMVEKYLHNLYRVRPDFVYSASRDFVRSCHTSAGAMRTVMAE
jgi:hypothetical protein